MPGKPFKSFGDLTAEDFAAHPIWIGCHGADADEPWYDETDEESFRPWDGAVPIDASAEAFLVRATATTAGGAELPAFLTPVRSAPTLAEMQPHVFVGGEQFGFWLGTTLGEATVAEFYAALAPIAEVFPLRVAAEPRIVSGPCEITVDGFYSGYPHATRIA